MKRHTIICFLLLINVISLLAQSGGNNVFDFLSLPNSARLTSLGGTQISIYDDDVNFIYQNPALLNPSMSNHVSLSFVDYLADIKYAYTSYARTVENYGNFGLGVHYIDYGKFDAANEYGIITGSFNNVSDYSINAYYSRSVFDSTIQVGTCFKTIGSQYEVYNAFAFALDAGISYYNPELLFGAAFVLKNLGTMVNTYYDGADNEPLPFELQLGITKKLKHAPFRFSILAHHLETPDLRYDSELDEDNQINYLTGEVHEESKLSRYADGFMRHINLGLEFVPGKNFYFNLGYNYKRREELKIDNKMGMVGLSWGFGVKIHMFSFSFGRARYHLAAASNHFTMNINLNEFNQKY